MSTLVTGIGELVTNDGNDLGIVTAAAVVVQDGLVRHRVAPQ